MGTWFMLYLLGGGAVVTGFVQWARSIDVRGWRRLRRTPRSLIATLVEGRPSKVIGRARAIDPDPLTAPLTGRPCIAYCIVASGNHKPPGAKTNEAYRVVEWSRAPIAVEDDSGIATVELEASIPRLLSRRIRSSPLRRLPFERLHTMLARHGVTRPGRIAWAEGVLLDGDEVVVGGLPTRDLALDDGTTERTFRQDLATRWRIRGNVDHPTRISDRPRGL